FLRFFFSSRRRHTRSKRDWSSDVCSSDLTSFRETSNFTARSYRTVLPGAALLLEWLAFGEEGFNLVIKHRQRGTDSHVHIQVLIRTQTSAEQYVVLARFRSRELAVLLQHLAVFWSVNGVIRLIALFRRA